MTNVAPSIKEALDWIVPILTGRGAPFHITGGFAAHLYGATRPVNDIDIDLPVQWLDLLVPEVKPFIELAPQRCRDSTWDLYLATLNYRGQLIDLTGDADAFVRNKETNHWERLEMNFGEAVWITAYGHRLPVQKPEDLIKYKRKIKYDEQKHLGDIQAVQLFISKQ